MLTTTEVYDHAALAALIAEVTVLGADLKAGLYTNTVNPTKVLTIADLTEATYPGYARQLVVMGAPFRDPVNGIAALAAGLDWFQTGTPAPVIIKGIFYVTDATPHLMGVEPFASPIALNDLLDRFTTVLEYIQSSQAQGFSTVIQ
jgi:hypothetical protein